MTWFKVDDGLAFHKKTVAAGNAAMGLWVRAGAHASHQLSDGFVPVDIVRVLGTIAQAERLVSVGFWLKTDGGYQFHEWTERNPTRAQKLEERAKRAESGRVGGKASGKSRREANAKQSASDVLQAPASQIVEPPSRPVPTRSIGASASQSSPIDDDGLDKIAKLTGGGRRHAQKTADFILAKAPNDVRSPLAYCIRAIETEPEAYRARRGNPKRGEDCPDHPGEWADACRQHALEEAFNRV